MRTPMTETTALRERLAALEDEQRAHWTRHLLDNPTPENVERRRGPIETPYGRLSESERRSNREWADRVLRIVKEFSWTKSRDRRLASLTSGQDAPDVRSELMNLVGTRRFRVGTAQADR